MNTPGQRQSNRSDESLEILRRLEPILKDIQAEQRRLADAQRKQGEDTAELKGRISQLPTLIQIIGSVLAINAGIVAIAFGLVGVMRSL
ncbi:MAG: hypothetical protein GC191_09245 [Azospirillum sp.]|nr:hypothetical protein [Azospirillum sp.]